MTNPNDSAFPQKQSSVEWLINEIDMQFPHIDIKWKENMISKAKAMHKQETVDFGNDLIAQNDPSYIGIPNLAEIYYNEIYGDGKETK